jgi:carbon monoxide dehydrogenase subunit G
MVLAGFMAFLAEVDVERDQEQQTRTRWSLTGRESEGQT